MPTRLHAIVIGSILLQAPFLDQAAAQVPTRARAFQQLAEPPVPSDPLELVTGDAQPVQEVSQRAEIINLLVNAHRYSNVRAQPYDLKTTFTVSGSLSSGTWQEEDMSPGAGRYRWSVQGPGFSAVNMNLNRIFYSDQQATGLPLRLIQFREAIFYTQPVVGPRATLRTATGTLNGVNLTCALVARDATVPAGTGGRQWEEEEYCVDPNAGTLITYSQAPGSYVLYDYSKGLRFHGKLIANGFTITEAGQTIIEAQTESLADPVNNPAAFQTAGLNQIGVGPVMSPAWRSQINLPSPILAPGATEPAATSQIVMLHGVQAPDGQLLNLEVLASSDPSLNQPALADAAKWHGGRMGPETGATPQSHEIMTMVVFSNPPQANAAALN
ncbi:MAG: hypothetical protein WBE37_14820 [Bryobacteraceae bacterium]